MRSVSLVLGLAGLVLSAAIACSASSETGSSQGGAGGAGTSASSSNAGGDSAAGTGGTAFTTTDATGTGGGPAGTGGGNQCVTGGGGAPGQMEICGNGVDENANGFVDEGCICTVGDTQACFPGLGAICECKVGTQTCVLSGEFGQWGPCEGAMMACAGPLDASCELCGNGVDDDCDGTADDGCVLDVMVNIDGDCVTAQCPPQAPYPVGCNIVFSGGDSRGCVANMPGSSVVFFKEGDKCGVGNVSGTLTCSSVQGAPLDDVNCPMNKSDKNYPADSNDCP